MDWFKCDWEDREGRRLTKWSHASMVGSDGEVPGDLRHFFPPGSSCAYLTTAAPPMFAVKCESRNLAKARPAKTPFLTTLHGSLVRLAHAAGLPLRLAAKLPRAENRYFNEIIKPLLSQKQCQVRRRGE
jgi:hypothetical protein